MFIKNFIIKLKTVSKFLKLGKIKLSSGKKAHYCGARYFLISVKILSSKTLLSFKSRLE